MANFKMTRFGTHGVGESIIAWRGMTWNNEWGPKNPEIFATDLSVRVTPRARTILNSAQKGSEHVAFTWNASLSEAYGPLLADLTGWKNHNVRYVYGPGVDDLRFGQVDIPGAAPQAAMGDGNQPTQTGMDAPFLRAFGGSFFDMALTPGSSISIAGGLSGGVTVDISAARAQFARSFGNKLRGFFGAEDDLPIVKPPPPPPPPSRGWVLYHKDDVFDTPPSGDPAGEIIPGNPPVEQGGGANERYLPLINSSLNKMSGQLARISEQLESLRGPWPELEDTGRFMDWMDLVNGGLNLAELLMGGAGAAAEVGAEIAGAAGNLAAINGLAKKFEDLIDALKEGGQDDLAEDRWEGLADLLQYNGKSFTQYLSEINDKLPKPKVVDETEPDLPPELEAWKELLDTYFLSEESSLMKNGEMKPRNLADCRPIMLPTYRDGSEVEEFID